VLEEDATFNTSQLYHLSTKVNPGNGKGGVNGRPDARHQLVPQGAREVAAGEKVVHGLRRLIAKDTSLSNGEAHTSETSRRFSTGPGSCEFHQEDI
jgi:hypothetical protein